MESLSNPNQKQIYLFIASSFLDMYAERNYLINQVIPNINKELKRHNIAFTYLDLSSIFHSNIKENEVLESCLDIFDLYQPIVIGLIGERYGWIPSVTTNQKSKYPLLTNYPERSITDYEIQHSISFSKKQYFKPLFYIRNPECIMQIPEIDHIEFYIESENRRKIQLDSLKNMVRKSGYLIMDNYSADWNPLNYNPYIKKYGTFENFIDVGVSIRNELFKQIFSNNYIENWHCPKMYISNRLNSLTV